MHRGVINCPSQTPLGEVAALVAGHSIHAVFVDGTARVPLRHERLVQGFVTDLDLLRAARAGRLCAEVGDVTASGAVTIHPDEDVAHAAQLMGEHQCSHLVAWT
jgi:CBS domain-containing protein